MKPTPIILNDKYDLFVKHTGRFTIATGGRGSAKSFSFMTMLIRLTFESGHRILVARMQHAASDNSTIALAKSIIEKLGWQRAFMITKAEIKNLTTGSSISFGGLQSSMKSASGKNKSLSEYTTLLIEEAEEVVDFEVFDKIQKSIRLKGKQNRIILIMNPATKAHWIWNHFYEKRGVPGGYNGIVEDTCYIHTTYLDNLEHLDEGYVKGFEAERIYSPERYEHIILGGWLERSAGVIYTSWEYGAFPDDVESSFGSDWGWSSDPSSLIEVFINKKERAIYLKEHLYETGLTTSQLSKIFKRVAGDRLIVADSSEGRLIEEIKQDGLNIRKCRKGAGSIVDGIGLIKDYKLIVDNGSSNLVKELNNYSWSGSGSGNPIDKDNHLLDAMRYICTHLLADSSGIYYIH